MPISSPFTIFNQISDFQGRLENLKEDVERRLRAQSCSELKLIREVIKILIEINKQEFEEEELREKGPALYKLRSLITECYREIIPLGFDIFKLPKDMIKVMKKDFDQWTAIPHFDKFEIDLTESSYTRDHYLHPLCVFGVGVYTLSCLCISRALTFEKVKEIFPYWLFCALLHDLGYVIEQYSKIIDVFFSKFLMVEYSATFNFKDIMFSGNYQRNLKSFFEELKLFLDHTVEDHDTFRDHDIKAVVYDALYTENDHGLISALSAYERLHNVITLFERLIAEGDLVRELRTKQERRNMIKELDRRWENETEYERFRWFKEKYFKNIRDKRNKSYPTFENIRNEFKHIREKEFGRIVLAVGIHNKLIVKLNQIVSGMKIKLSEYPLVFLLLYCDVIQDWGRSKQTNNKFELKELRFEEGQSKIIADYRIPGKCEDNEIISKMAELDRTSKYLSIEDFSFEINFGKYRTFSTDQE